jgi:hypothetical protein
LKKFKIVFRIPKNSEIVSISAPVGGRGYTENEDYVVGGMVTRTRMMRTLLRLAAAVSDEQSPPLARGSPMRPLRVGPLLSPPQSSGSQFIPFDTMLCVHE